MSNCRRENAPVSVAVYVSGSTCVSVSVSASICVSVCAALTVCALHLHLSALAHHQSLEAPLLPSLFPHFIVSSLPPSLSFSLSVSCSFVLSLGQPPLLVSRAFYALLLTLAKLWPQPLEGIIIVLGFRDPLLINNSTAALRVIIHLSSLLFCRVQVEGLMIIVLLWGSLIWTI